MIDNKTFGYEGEDLACDYLFNNGYSIVERNFSCKIGELDIVAIDHSQKDQLVFVEVKTRKNFHCGHPAESVNTLKKRHIYRTAEYYLLVKKLQKAFCRFDVIEILNYNSNLLKINHIKNAIIDNPYC